MRCKCCNRVLSESRILKSYDTRIQGTGKIKKVYLNEEEDLCGSCINKSKLEYDFTDDMEDLSDLGIDLPDY